MSPPEKPPTDRSLPPSLSQLYQEVIIDHYRRPRNRGALAAATHRITMNNPLCGDIIHLHLRLERERVVEARFEGRGCSISQASASMMTGLLKDRSVPEALRLTEKFTRLLHGDPEAARDPELGDLRSLAGVSRFPVRIKCALLAWNGLEELVGRARGGDPAVRP